MAYEEKLMRNFLAEEKRQKEEEEEIKAAQPEKKANEVKKPAGPKLKSAPSMRSRGRANVQRISNLKL